jgi:hypothetical protein
MAVSVFPGAEAMEEPACARLMLKRAGDSRRVCGGLTAQTERWIGQDLEPMSAMKGCEPSLSLT